VVVVSTLEVVHEAAGRKAIVAAALAMAKSQSAGAVMAAREQGEGSGRGTMLLRAGGEGLGGGGRKTMDRMYQKALISARIRGVHHPL